MKKNIGQLDKFVRTIIVLIIATLYFLEMLTGTMGSILMAVATGLLLTSFVNFCPIYQLLGISTRETHHA